MRSNDVNYRYRQESNFLYLTGITKPKYTLMVVHGGVSVDGRTAEVILFLPPGSLHDTTEYARIPDGLTLGADRFRDVLGAVSRAVRTLYVSAPDLGFVHDWLNDKPMFLDRDARKEFERTHPGVRVKSPAGIMARLRAIKSTQEVAAIRRAIDATAEGLLMAMRECRPGRPEYEIQAAVEYGMIRKGASYPAFPSIIGSGPNSLILHYEENRRTMEKGDVVVMDVGAEVAGYAADVTRTIPVSGKFTPEQKKVYTVVLEAQQALCAAAKPGAVWSDLENVARQVINDRGFGRFWRHGVSHHLGIDVHDLGATDTLRVGMVITVEPGIYIPAADTTVTPGYRGWGVRIEDDILITADGCEVLSSAVPKEVSAIEALMNPRRGVAGGGEGSRP
jgi:Xaa-Pro aminopeptidase